MNLKVGSTPQEIGSMKNNSMPIQLKNKEKNGFLKLEKKKAGQMKMDLTPLQKNTRKEKRD